MSCSGPSVAGCEGNAVAVRSRRLFGPSAAGSAGVPLAIYTVPAGRTAIVRSLFVAKTSTASDGNFTLRLNGSSSGFGLYATVALAGVMTWILPDELVLNPGDVLWTVFTGATNVVRVSAFGSLLEGAPE